MRNRQRLRAVLAVFGLLVPAALGLLVTPVGLALVAGTGFLALALASYNPTDPSFLGTSTTEPRNWLGHFGAYTAAPFYVILGLGSWAMVAACGVWGVRFVLHLGEERAFGRAIFAPVSASRLASSRKGSSSPPQITRPSGVARR